MSRTTRDITSEYTKAFEDASAYMASKGDSYEQTWVEITKLVGSLSSLAVQGKLEQLKQQLKDEGKFEQLKQQFVPVRKELQPLQKLIAPTEWREVEDCIYQQTYSFEEIKENLSKSANKDNWNYILTQLPLAFSALVKSRNEWKKKKPFNWHEFDPDASFSGRGPFVYRELRIVELSESSNESPSPDWEDAT